MYIHISKARVWMYIHVVFALRKCEQTNMAVELKA